MSRKTIMDEFFKRWDVAVCDTCGMERTIEVAKAVGWRLGSKKDYCKVCAERAPKAQEEKGR